MTTKMRGDQLDVGTGPDQVVQLVGSPAATVGVLPAVDGSNLVGVATSVDLVDDTSPQLGGNLDLNTFELISTDVTTTDNPSVVVRPGGTSYAGGGYYAGGLSVHGGAATNGNYGGGLYVKGGTASGVGGYGGGTTIYGGVGDVDVTGGWFWVNAGYGGRAGGQVLIEGGDTSGEVGGLQYGGPIRLRAGTSYGTSTGQQGGHVLITGGEASADVVDGRGGRVRLVGGAGTYRGGDIEIISGPQYGTTPANPLGASGHAFLKSGPAVDITGSVTIASGISSAGTSGSVTVVSGNVTGLAGSPAGQLVGNVNVTGGAATGASTADGGHVNITGGASIAANGGNIKIAPGGGATSDGVVELHYTVLKTGQASLQFWNDTDTGHTTGNYVALQAPAGSPAIADLTLVLPREDGTNGQVLSTNGAGNLSFDNVGVANGGTGGTTVASAQENLGILAGRWFLDAVGSPFTPSFTDTNFTGATTTYISPGRYRFTYPFGDTNYIPTLTQELNSSKVYNIRIVLRASTHFEIDIRDSATGALITGTTEVVNFQIVSW